MFSAVNTELAKSLAYQKALELENGKASVGNSLRTSRFARLSFAKKI
jgi:hypothetical protein